MIIRPHVTVNQGRFTVFIAPQDPTYKHDPQSDPLFTDYVIYKARVGMSGESMNNGDKKPSIKNQKLTIHEIITEQCYLFYSFRSRIDNGFNTRFYCGSYAELLETILGIEDFLQANGFSFLLHDTLDSAWVQSSNMLPYFQSSILYHFSIYYQQYGRDTGYKNNHLSYQLLRAAYQTLIDEDDQPVPCYIVHDLAISTFEKAIYEREAGIHTTKTFEYSFDLARESVTAGVYSVIDSPAMDKELLYALNESRHWEEWVLRTLELCLRTIPNTNSILLASNVISLYTIFLATYCKKSTANYSELHDIHRRLFEVAISVIQMYEKAEREHSFAGPTPHLNVFYTANLLHTLVCLRLGLEKLSSLSFDTPSNTIINSFPNGDKIRSYQRFTPANQWWEMTPTEIEYDDIAIFDTDDHTTFVLNIDTFSGSPRAYVLLINKLIEISELDYHHDYNAQQLSILFHHIPQIYSAAQCLSLDDEMEYQLGSYLNHAANTFARFPMGLSAYIFTVKLVSWSDEDYAEQKLLETLDILTSLWLRTVTEDDQKRIAEDANDLLNAIVLRKLDSNHIAEAISLYFQGKAFCFKEAEFIKVLQNKKDQKNFDEIRTESDRLRMLLSSIQRNYAINFTSSSDLFLENTQRLMEKIENKISLLISAGITRFSDVRNRSDTLLLHKSLRFSDDGKVYLFFIVTSTGLYLCAFYAGRWLRSPLYRTLDTHTMSIIRQRWMSVLQREPDQTDISLILLWLDKYMMRPLVHFLTRHSFPDYCHTVLYCGDGLTMLPIYAALNNHEQLKNRDISLTEQIPKSNEKTYSELSPKVFLFLGSRDQGLSSVIMENTCVRHLFEAQSQGCYFELGLNHPPDKSDIFHRITTSDVVHVACHAHFDHRQPSISTMLIGDVEITSDELAVCNLREHRPLVFLSICQGLTNDGYFGPDEGHSIGHRFIKMGARAVVASLWETYSFSSVLFSYYFYCGLLMGNQFQRLLCRPRTHYPKSPGKSSLNASARQRSAPSSIFHLKS